MSRVSVDPFSTAGLRATTTVHLLARDRSLGEGLDPSDATRAADQAWARVVELPAGVVDLPADPRRFGGWFGLLLLDGFLLRRVEARRASRTELLGAGDLVRPWTAASPALASAALASEPAQVRFEVVARTRLALLDRAFALRVAPWPEIAAALLERAAGRAHALSCQLAGGRPVHAEERVWTVLWQLAGRWGTTSGDDVELALPSLSHRVLAEMTGSRRPAVTLAVRRLAAAGLLTHRPRHGWTLHGPPESLDRIGAPSDRDDPE